MVILFHLFQTLIVDCSDQTNETRALSVYDENLIYCCNVVNKQDNFVYESIKKRKIIDEHLQYRVTK